MSLGYQYTFNVPQVAATRAATTASLWPLYRQRYPLMRVVMLKRRRQAIVRVHRLQRLRQRPMSAWAPLSNVQPGIAYPRMFQPFRIWTLKPPGSRRISK